MRITLEEAARIARLAHLRFSDDGLARMRGQLDLILEHVGALQALDLAGSGTSAPAGEGEAQVLREDAPLPTLGSGEALEASPESGQGHFKVPRVIA
jgi:aspartyl-tRNA(Asn)/glutamyl-tRNA(Gln) amidotransferase subunit C